MGVCLFANDAVASLANAVLTTDTALTLATGSGASFPSPAGGDFFNAVIYNATQQEYVKCTARATDVLTVQRAQENTAALAFSAGDKVELRLTAATMDGVAQTVNLGNSSTRSVGTAPGTVADGSAGVPTGGLVPFAGAGAPAGWLMANGAAVSRSTYASLFAAIGTAYGAGDGSTTFNLPDMVDHTAMGAGGAYALASSGGSATMAVTVAPHTLAITEMPVHVHTVSDPGHTHGVVDGGHSHGVSDPGHTHGINDPGHAHSFTALEAPWNGANNDVQAGTQGSQKTDNTTVNGTGIGIYAANAGITLSGASSNISLGRSGTSVSLDAAGDGQAHTHGASATTNLPPYVALNWIIKT